MVIVNREFEVGKCACVDYSKAVSCVWVDSEHRIFCGRIVTGVSTRSPLTSKQILSTSLSVGWYTYPFIKPLSGTGSTRILCCNESGEKVSGENMIPVIYHDDKVSCDVVI